MDVLESLLREMRTLRATNGHGAPVLGQRFGVLSRQDKKTQARVETNLLSDPSLLSPSGGKTCKAVALSASSSLTWQVTQKKLRKPRS